MKLRVYVGMGRIGRKGEGMEYERRANKLVERIVESMKAHPEARTVTSVWELFKVPGFKCDDLQPSLAQAEAALSVAKRRF